jgi:putative ABC transport system permease protein
MLADVRYAARALTRTPLFAVLAISTLGLGIGANTAIFSVVNTLLLRPLPYADPERLVTIWEVTRGRDNVSGSPANYLYWRDAATTVEAMAAISNTSRTTFSGQGEPEELPMQYVTANVFPILGVAPELGRTFTADEDQPNRNRVVVISDRLWRRRFSADPSVIGRTVDFDGAHVIVGVMPPGFSIRDKTVDVWKPVGFSAASRRPSGRWIQVIARLKPGVTAARAQQEMNHLQADLIRMFPAFDTGWGVHVRTLKDDLTGDVRPALFVLLGAVGFVLLIACANVSNLLLARATSRHRELAVRATLGADRRRLAQQMLVEAGLLSAAGGTVGLLLAWWSVVTLRTTMATHLPVQRLEAVHVDAWVLTFAAIVSVLSAIVFGMAPALAASGVGLVDALKEGGRSGTARRGVRSRNLFVTVETALALVLLVGAGLLVRSFVALMHVDAGFDPSHTISMKITLPTAKSREAIPFFDRLYSQIDAIPGVEASGGVSFLPLNGLGSATDFTVVGRPKPSSGNEPVADVRVVTHDYFKAMRIPLVEGRFFDSRDTGDHRRHVIVSEALVRQFFPNEDPIGKQIVIDWDDTVPDEIVGVVGDVHLTTLDAEPRATTYWPPARFAYPWNSVVIRTPGDPARIMPQVAAIVRQYDPTIALADVRTLDQVMSISVAERRLTMLLLTAFAALALVLAAIGIYGVVSYAVSQRTHEIGIRMALGAERTAVVRMIVSQALGPTLAGIAVGFAGAWALTRLMQALLFSTAPSDPATYAAVAGLLMLVALAAAGIPGLRATRVDPVVALRSE